MKNNRYIVVAVFFIICHINNLYAQNFDELRKKFPGEKAVMLNKTMEYHISAKNGLPQVESHEVQQIAYLLGSATTYMSDYGFSHSDFQKLVSHQAYTRTPTNEKIKVTEFKTASNKESFVFYDDVKYTTFNFPAVQPGAVGNLEVSRVNTDPHMLSPFYFESYMPVVNSALKITVAKDVVLKYRIRGLDTANIIVKVEKIHGDQVYTFQYQNCPADKRYPDAPGYSWYEPHIIFNIEKYKGANGETVSYLSNLDDLYKLTYGYIKSINTTPSPELKHIVDSLTAKSTSEESKARNIYSWVQNNIKYVAFEDGMEGFVPRDASLVCSRRFGDCKDMASILTQMLKAAGLQAYFTWLGTRDLPYKFSDLPLPMVSNHMICTVNINGKYIFLDGTDATCVFGSPSYAIQDKEAMIAINDKDYKVLKIPAIEKANNALTDSTWLELTPTGIKGKIKQYREGYFASETYATLMYLNGKIEREKMKHEFERGSNKFLLDTFTVAKKQTFDKITLFANFSLPDYAKKLGDEYYLNLNLFKFYANQEIDFPRRQMPIEYNFKFVKKYVTLLKIPAGYKVTYMPKGKTFNNKVWGFNLQYEQKGGWIILTQEFNNENLMLTTDQFEPWNKVLENLFPLYKETLSLAKI